MNPLFSIVIVALLITSCQTKTQEIGIVKKDNPLITYVNPFIGTGGHGHTYPGATLPFGMMQLSPDTRLDGWDGCSGYHYTDNYIYGFSHTHLSGTGVSDYGDVLLMPTNVINFNNGSDGTAGYRAHFSHDNETAEPGYYRVKLDTTEIEVELTVSKRSGIQKYQFPSADHQYVILDLEHRDELLNYKIQKINDSTLSGFRHSKAWAKDQRLFYIIQFSQPIKSMTYNENGTHISKNYKFQSKQAAIELDNPNNKPVSVKIGISAVDVAGAHNNLNSEIGNKPFDVLKKEAQNTWETQLEKIVVTSQNSTYKTNFYTALYHTMLSPNLYQDVDGRYRGMDLKIHQTKDFDYYTVFSLWDTYRAVHPLYTIIEQDKTNDFIQTFLAKYDEGGILPIWDLSANYTGCMIGYHAVSVISDAYVKGIRSYDTEKAFGAMKHSATRDKLGLKSYKDFGFIPVESESESVSKTLEYAYDDWTIAQMAKAMGQDDDYKNYIKRAQNYKNVYDPETKFMRGRFRNTWFSPFDPNEVNFNYTEANSWQYSFYVPQDITGFINLLGGKAKLEAQLDQLFTAETKTSGRHQVDITGLIGQYAHGNEPSHHMAYLYNFVNAPHKTQERVRQILTELYSNAPDGISGNEDCGQMSAWYVFSSMGFYPVTPGSNQYIIGTPLFDDVAINLESGATFNIKAHNLSETSTYIEAVYLNGAKLNRSYLTHQDIMKGGLLEFYMTSTPATWGSMDGEEPRTAITEQLIVPAPYIAKGDIAFKKDTEVVLANSDKKASIYYAFGNANYMHYQKPFKISEPTTLHVYAEKNGVKSPVITTSFYKINQDLSITLHTNYANQYNAGGNDALIDGVLGTKDFRTGTWQGYWGEDVIATLDLGHQTSMSLVSVNFLQDQGAWIFYPSEVECLVSNDGIHFKSVKTFAINSAKKNDSVSIKTIAVNMPSEKYRYIHIVAKKLESLPTWHLGYTQEGKPWIFVDEIRIK